MNDYEARLERARKAIREADRLVIGGGAGLSDAAGLKYEGARFTDNFAPFIARYGMTDMYSASFHPFETEEERWAYWAKHIDLNRYEPTATALYRSLLALVRGKEHFVVTTNVDHQFQKAGFADERIFAVQGDYGFFQCARGCHDRLYDNEETVRTMLEQTKDCAIPSRLVPRCPVCGGPMDVNLRKDATFVEGAAWEAASRRYLEFLDRADGGRLVFLELGVGFNTPGIIRFPFEQMTFEHPEALLIRFNDRHPFGPEKIAAKTIPFSEEMATTVERLVEAGHA